MIELFALALITLAVVLYAQARFTARGIRRNRIKASRLPAGHRMAQPAIKASGPS